MIKITNIQVQGNEFREGNKEGESARAMKEKGTSDVLLDDILVYICCKYIPYIDRNISVSRYQYSNLKRA